MKTDNGPEIRIVTMGSIWRIVGAVSAWFVPGRAAVTLGRTVYAYVSPLPPTELDHERIHILQFQREGFRMWPKYMWFFVRNWLRFRDRRTAYLENPYEVEARGDSRTV